ncbi:MAG: DUF4834 family protein [Bacteroidia bacterium]|nr:DUF4834 family protein [Bacteroidia bacterium]
MSFLLKLILGYLILRLIGRFLFPSLLRMFVNNTPEHMNNNNGKQQQQPSTKEGETRIQQTSTTNSKSNLDNQGDYVDFKEIK